MSSSEIMAAILFFITISGALWAIWWRIEGRVKDARHDAMVAASAAQALAALARDELASHRLHVAETYITKAGMRETTEQLLDAIQGVKAAVDHMTVRVDRVVENQAKPPRTRAS